MKKNSVPIPPVIIEIRPSKMLPGQIGLFAARSLKKDSIIAEASKLGEHFVPWSDIKLIDPVTRKKIPHYCLQTEKGFFLPKDFNLLTVPWNMNHSCGYNVGFDDFGNFVAVRAIKKDEELLWDYGMGMSNPNYTLNCVCGSKICRKLITGDDWKNNEYMLKNRRYFSRELLKKAGISKTGWKV